MKTYRCKNCNIKITYGGYSIKRYCKLSKRGYKWFYQLKCPNCNNIRKISFWKIPLKSKIQFIKERLKFFDVQQKAGE